MRKVCSTNLLLLLLRAPSVRLRGNDVRDENQTCLPLATDTLRDPLVLSDYGQVSCTTGSDQLFYESQPAMGRLLKYIFTRQTASELPSCLKRPLAKLNGSRRLLAIIDLQANFRASTQAQLTDLLSLIPKFLLCLHVHSLTANVQMVPSTLRSES
jgi:hypothetical protein